MVIQFALAGANSPPAYDLPAVSIKPNTVGLTLFGSVFLFAGGPRLNSYWNQWMYMLMAKVI